MIRIAIAGGFDPFHPGHLDHVKKAAQLGDYLFVFVSNDKDMIRKKGKCNLPLHFRMKTVELWMRECNIAGEVVETLDIDGTQANTLRFFKPNIFAKGGDRTPYNMPTNEIETCKEIGCKIMYGIGDQLASSSQFV